MGTGAHRGQAVALAVRRCLEANRPPRSLLEPAQLRALQVELMRAGMHLPRRRREDPEDLAVTAEVSASSEHTLSILNDDGNRQTLVHSWAQMVSLSPGRVPRFTYWVDAVEPTVLVTELRTSDHPDNHTPDRVLARREIPLEAGNGVEICTDFDVNIDEQRYAFLTFSKNDAVSLHLSSVRLTGVLSVVKSENRAVSNHGEQIPPADRDIGVERFEFWCPQRRPAGHNIALRIEPPLVCFSARNLVNGIARPTHAPNAWVASPNDSDPRVILKWDATQTIRRIILTFDCDYDHPAESSLWGHPERIMPFCVRSWRVCTADRELDACDEQRSTRAEIVLTDPVETDHLVLMLGPTHGGAPAAVFEISCFR